MPVFVQKSIFFLFTFLVLLVGVNKTGKGQIVSFQTGAWNSNTTWIGGVIPSTTDDVTINHTVTISSSAEINDLYIGTTGKLIINNSLVLNGNLTMPNNNPELITNTGASVFVFGSATLANKVTVDLSSYFIVLQNLTFIGGGGASIDIDNASIYVFGLFDAGSTGLESCDYYDNLTVNKSDTCHIGTETAFVDNVANGEIPPEISELVIPCTPPSITNPGNQSSCDSYTLPTITGSNLSGNQKYYDDSQANSGQDITGTISTSQTVWIYDANGTCSDEESFLVTINETPLIDDPADVVACDSYSLPALTTGNYFTGTGGTGTVLSAGASITSTQTIYVYAETGTTPNCTAENSFLVTVNPLPTVIISSTNDPICEQDNAEFTITGTPNAQVTYNINGNPNSTATLSTGGTATISYIVGIGDGDQTITLKSVTNGTCTQSLNLSETITVNLLPIIGGFN